MINSICFENYKCLSGQSFSLKKVNIFSGYNGRGKSSVLQSILMLSQSIHTDADIEKLHLNGHLVELGDYSELLTDESNEQLEFGFAIFPEGGEQARRVRLSYTADALEDVFIGKLVSCLVDDVEQFAVIRKPDEVETGGGKEKASAQSPQWLKDQFKDVCYISADRKGPVKYVERQERPSVHRIDPHGRNSINILNTYKEKVPSSMNLDGNDMVSHPLGEVVSDWISYIMCDRNSVVEVPDKSMGRKKNSVLSLEYKMDDKSFSSYHVGFGYSYILSIIEAALIAKKGSLVIIENPEAHLHAKAQSRLTLLLAKLTDRGVQVFVETHSEHIVNGFRLVALKDESALTAADLSIFFFDEDFSVRYLEVQPNGRILQWPEGFFDQAKNDLAEIIRLGAKVRQG